MEKGSKEMETGRHGMGHSRQCRMASASRRIRVGPELKANGIKERFTAKSPTTRSIVTSQMRSGAITSVFQAPRSSPLKTHGLGMAKK